LKNKNL